MSPNDRSARRLMLGAAVVVVAVAVGHGRRLALHAVAGAVPRRARRRWSACSATRCRRAIDDFGWDIDDEATRQDGTQPGQILEHPPGGGQELREGETLTVVVSQGATLVDLPEGLVGMTGDDAARQLEAVGLRCPSWCRSRATSRRGHRHRLRRRRAAGGQVPKGSTVRLAVSSGDEFEMPDLAGRPYAEAVAELEAMGLEVEVEERRDGDDVEPGQVIRTDPEARRARSSRATR